MRKISTTTTIARDNWGMEKIPDFSYRRYTRHTATGWWKSFLLYFGQCLQFSLFLYRRTRAQSWSSLGGVGERSRKARAFTTSHKHRPILTITFHRKRKNNFSPRGKRWKTFVWKTPTLEMKIPINSGVGMRSCLVKVHRSLWSFHTQVSFCFLWRLVFIRRFREREWIILDREPFMANPTSDRVALAVDCEKKIIRVHSWTWK